MALNEAWHLAHPMPPRATLAQRAEWHLEHQAQCGCRKIPVRVAEYLERQVRSGQQAHH